MMRNQKGQFVKGYKPATSFKKGHKSWQGKIRSPFTAEWRNKLSAATVGNKRGIGYKMTDEQKKRHSERMKGNKYNYQGGKTSSNLLIRTSLKIKLWRKSCMERDNFTCQKTGVCGGDLVVHHINNFADYPELRFSPENGITLSKKSHIEFHKIYGKRNNTKEQLQEFLGFKNHVNR
jgi:hypothetical protein